MLFGAHIVALFCQHGGVVSIRALSMRADGNYSATLVAGGGGYDGGGGPSCFMAEAVLCRKKWAEATTPRIDITEL